MLLSSLSSILSILADGRNPIAKDADYRRYDAYAAASVREQTNRESIKENIDLLLPDVNSYEELLDRLRDMGYEIKDKKANGEWREHITFKAPGQLKGTRDGSLGDGEFYTRNILDWHIRKNAASRKSNISQHDISTVGSVLVPQRSGLERKVSADTYDVHTELKAIENSPYRNFPNMNRDQYMELLRNQISDNLKTLVIIGNKKLYSYGQIIEQYKSVYAAYNEIIDEISGLEKELARLEKSLSVKDKLDSLEARISAGELDQYRDLVQAEILLEKYRKDHERSGLYISHSRENIRESIAVLQDKLNTARPQIDNCREELASLDLCVRTLVRIDRKRGVHNEHLASEYYKIIAMERNKENERSRGERTRGYER